MSASSNDRDPVECLAEEFAERRWRGERPTIDEYAARHPDLADAIRDLFPALLMMEDLGDGSLGVTGPQVAQGDAPSRRLGDFRLLREVGRGGMGVVYEAEQESLGRHVALKVLPAQALLDAKHVQRFQREARAAARLHHTNIVPVFGVGEEGGLHYYVMQFIQGLGLHQVLDELRRLRRCRNGTTEAVPPAATERPPAGQVAEALLTGRFSVNPGKPPAEPEADTPVPAALAVAPSASDSATSIHLPGQDEHSTLSESGRGYWQGVARVGVQVAEALAHAHGHGILHRDIKPANLLLDMHGTVWVTDFGLAKADDGDGLTQTGDIVGTLRYMAPERFGGKSDPRSDLYGLGVTLYELLTLRPAFAEADHHKLLQRVLHEEPPRLRKLNPEVPRDLETIVLKAIAKEPRQRYASAAEMAEDLRRFLADRPVKARRASVLERLWRWVRRNPAVATACGLAAVALLTLLVVLTAAAIYYAAFSKDLASARDGASEARENEKRGRLEALALARESLCRLRGVNATHGMFLAEQGDLFAALPRFAEAVKLVEALSEDKDDRVKAESYRLRLGAALRECPRLLHVWFPGGAEKVDVHEAHFSPDGGRLVLLITGDGSHVRLWDAATGKPGGPPVKHAGGAAWDVVSRAGDRWLFLLPTGDGSHVRLWDAATGKPAGPPLEHAGPVAWAALSRAGGRVVTAAADRTARVWDAETGRPISPPLEHGGAVYHATFSPDGTRVATLAADGTARVWDAGTGKRLVTCKHKEVRRASFSPDGRRLATAGADVFVWDADKGALLVELKGPHSSACSDVLFGPDGSCLLTVGFDTARVWDAASGSPVTPPLKHYDPILYAAFSPDGRRVSTASDDGTARVWDAATGEPVTPPLRHGNKVRWASFSPDGSRLATACWDGTARLWDLAPAGPAVPPLPHRGDLVHLAFRSDGGFIGTASADGTARVWDAATGLPVTPPLRHDNQVLMVAFRPDGRRLATASADGTARVWDALTGAAVTPPLKHGGPVRGVSFSPDGRRLVTASDDQTAQVWDAGTGEKVLPPLRHKRWVGKAIFSPDGRWLATLGERGDPVRVWEVATGKLVAALPFTAQAWTVAFSPDSRRVVTAQEEHVAIVWDAATGQPLSFDATTDQPKVRIEHGNAVVDASLSPDGTRVATASLDWTVRVWDTWTGALVMPILKHGEPVARVLFSPDGRYLLTITNARTARLWDAATGEPVTPALKHWGPVRTACFSPDGRRVVTDCGNEARVWDLPFAEGRAEDLARLAQFLANERIQAGGEARGVLPLTTEELRRDWDRVCSSSLPALTGRGRMKGGEDKEKEVVFFDGHTDDVWTVACSPDGKKALTASVDKSIRLWDMATGRKLKRFTGHEHVVFCAAFSRAGDRIVSGSADKTIRLWDAESGKELKRFGGHEDEVWWVAFSPDGRSVLSAGKDKTIRLWDMNSAKEHKRFKGHTEPVRGVAFSPDGKRILSGSWDRTVRLWDVETGRELRRFEGHTNLVHSVAFSPDGSLALSGSKDSTARLWDVETGRSLHQLVGHVGEVHAVAFAPDGRSVLTGGGRGLTGGYDGTVRLWDVGTGRELHRFEGHAGAAWGVAFSPDGRTLLSGSADGTARLWRIPDKDKPVK
jgi:WD40 repeat protein/serine/threonine protein kinase